MNNGSAAGFFRRAMSTLVDLTLVIAVVTGTFYLLGRPLLQKQVEDYDLLNGAYQELTDAYEAESAILQEEYSASLELAGDDEALQTEAYNLYWAEKNSLSQQYSVDIEPYNASLSVYLGNSILYFLIGFFVLMSIYTVVLNGKTLGRKFLQVKLEGPFVNPLSVFFHDVAFKYLFVILFAVSDLLIGIMVFLAMLVLDLIMITMTNKKTALRDRLLKMSVVKTGFQY